MPSQKTLEFIYTTSKKTVTTRKRMQKFVQVMWEYSTSKVARIKGKYMDPGNKTASSDNSYHHKHWEASSLHHQSLSSDSWEMNHSWSICDSHSTPVNGDLTILWLLHSSSGLHILKRMLRSAKAFSIGNKAAKCAGRCALWGEAEDTGLSAWIRPRRDLTALCNFLRRRSRGRCGALLPVNDDRMCGKGTKLCQERIRVDIRKNFFTTKVAKPWDRPPWEALMPHAVSLPED